MAEVNLFHGDCLEILPTIPDKSVDAIITDLPYGTTACKWDVIIPLEPMWKQVKRLLRNCGAFVTTSAQPFTSVLIASNLEWFKYTWIWEKVDPVGFLNANFRPLQKTEDICVFSAAGAGAGNKQTEKMNYFPQGLTRIDKLQRNRPIGRGFQVLANTTKNNVINSSKPYTQYFTGYPNNILRHEHDANKKHPTQKPVALYEYLIRTYTNEGDTVLDFCMGSGTTGVACMRTNRNFIGMEMLPVKQDDPDYFGIASRRIAEAQQIALPL